MGKQLKVVRQEFKARPDILLETFERLQKLLGSQLDTITVERAVFGIFFSGVKLNNGFGGVCFTPIKEIPEAVCCPSELKAMPESGKLKGMKVKSIVADMSARRSPLSRTLGVAVLNALSNMVWNSGAPIDYRVVSGADPLDCIKVPDDAYVVVIGALVPYMRMLRERGKPFCILEKDPRTLRSNELPFYAPAEKAAEKVPQADFLIITGATTINGTLESLLSLSKPTAQIVVVGPTASMLPEAFFCRGVTAIGGVRVTKADELLNIISEAGSGYHFLGKSAEKMVMMPK